MSAMLLLPMGSMIKSMKISPTLHETGKEGLIKTSKSNHTEIFLSFAHKEANCLMHVNFTNESRNYKTF